MSVPSIQAVRFVVTEASYFRLGGQEELLGRLFGRDAAEMAERLHEMFVSVPEAEREQTIRQVTDEILSRRQSEPQLLQLL